MDHQGIRRNSSPSYKTGAHDNSSVSDVGSIASNRPIRQRLWAQTLPSPQLDCGPVCTAEAIRLIETLLPQTKTPVTDRDMQTDAGGDADQQGKTTDN